jgi:hypothetical protein
LEDGINPTLERESRGKDLGGGVSSTVKGERRKTLSEHGNEKNGKGILG